MDKIINDYCNEIKQNIDNINKNQIINFAEILIKAKENNSNIFIMGNGGSAATASHFSCDFNKGLVGKDEKRFKIMCLNDSIPTMLAYANDQSYGNIFVEQLKNFLTDKDIVIGISVSGNSLNIIKAIEYADRKGCNTIAFTQNSDSKLAKIAKNIVTVETNIIEVTEDVHSIIFHLTKIIIKNMLNK